MTLSDLQTKRDALVSAMASGTLELTSGDKTIRYQSADQMQRALAVLDKEIAVASGSAVTRTVLVQHGRG
jgi:hypothetical protein